MREILNGYNEIFEKWSSQKLKINDIEREILYLEADLKTEKAENSRTVEHEVSKAALELKAAEALVAKLESDPERNGQSGKRNRRTEPLPAGMGRIKGEVPAENSVEEIDRKLDAAKEEVKSCRDYCDFVSNTYEEQMKLWEVAYKRYSIQISSLRERLKIEEVVLNSYSEELEEYKAKLQTVLMKV